MAGVGEGGGGGGVTRVCISLNDEYEYHFNTLNFNHCCSTLLSVVAVTLLLQKHNSFHFVGEIPSVYACFH